jgi:hypothetical protein
MFTERNLLQYQNYFYFVSKKYTNDHFSFFLISLHLPSSVAASVAADQRKLTLLNAYKDHKAKTEV